jgi:hypothetical protein
MKLPGGQAYIGLVGSGLVYSNKIPISQVNESNFGLNIVSLKFNSNSVLNTYPVASSFTSIRYPDTFLRIEEELNKIRSWMNIKLFLDIPPVFKILFDSDAISGYERIFSYLIKVIIIIYFYYINIIYYFLTLSLFIYRLN